MQLINYHLLRFFGAQDLSHLPLLRYMKLTFEEELDDFVWSGIVFQGNYGSGIFPVILDARAFFLHRVCLQDSYIRNHSPALLLSSKKWNGRLLISQLLHEFMFTHKVYIKNMTYLVRWLNKINISLVLNKRKCMKHSFYHRFIYEQIWIILKR